jgi:hypothetical protein
MRVSDAEREAAAAELREHFTSGRLDQEELDQRLTAAFAARTRGDLDALFTDVPPASGREWSGGSTAGGQAAGPRPFGTGSFGGGPFGAGPFGAGPFGASAAERDDRDAARAAGAGWPGQGGWPGGGGWRASAGRGIGRLALASALIWALFILGILGVFGIGTGRPVGVVLIVAAFALLRRLVFIFLGRRRGRGAGRPRGRGPRRRH